MYSPVKLWRNQKYIASFLGKEGVIVSYTLIRIPPEGFSAEAPYPVAVVSFSGGERITVQLVDWEEKDLAIGRRVVVVVRRTTEPSNEDVIPYGIKVRPI